MIPIADPIIGTEESESVVDVLDSGMLADGPVVREFESAFASYVGTEHGVATSNGTTALHAAMAAVGIGEGDRVLTTPFSFIATANTIRLTGAEPVFADVDPDTYNLDPAAAREAAEAAGDIDAIIPVHLYGLPASMDEIIALAEEYDAVIIEDAAQAHGATYDGKSVGTLGDVACFSFYPTKNMTTGEGGMILTNDESIAEDAATFVNHGRGDDGTYTHQSVGHNFRMTSIAAAIGQAQLDRLPDFIEDRRANAAALDDGLSDASVVTPTVPADRTHVYHQYTVRVDDREAFINHLSEHEVGYGIYYPTCIHDQPAFDDVDHNAPVAERASCEVVSLPVHPNVSGDDIDRIVEVVSNYE